MINHTMKQKGRPAEILLVEDNKGDVVLTKEAFKTSKIKNHISVANDGEMALQMLRREAPYEDASLPDIILLDLNLPKVDGREVLEAIKEDDELRRIPVIILTSSQADMDIIKSYDLHANAYIAKPMDLQSFERIVVALEHFWFEVVVYAGDH